MTDHPYRLIHAADVPTALGISKWTVRLIR